MGRRVADFEAVKVTVPAETDVVPGTFYVLDDFIGMAMERVTTGVGVTSTVALEVKLAEYETSQINAADAFALGDDVYFDIAAGLFRSVAHGAAAPATSERIGQVTIAKDANDVVNFVRQYLG